MSKRVLQTQVPDAIFRDFKSALARCDQTIDGALGDAVYRFIDEERREREEMEEDRRAGEGCE